MTVGQTLGYAGSATLYLTVIVGSVRRTWWPEVSTTNLAKHGGEYHNIQAIFQRWQKPIDT